MPFLLTLVITLVVVSVLRTPMRKCPWAFYLLCIVLDALLIALTAGALPYEVALAVIPLLRRGFIAVSLFVIVMYIGIFPYGSKVRNYFAPIRAVISICACILAIGHMCIYFTAYILDLFSSAHSWPIVVAMGAGLILLALLLILGITSFRVVRRSISGRNWIKLQKLAYVFYALIYVHAAFLLIPPAIKGGQAAQVSIAVYTAVFGIYAVARIMRAHADRQNSRAHDLRQQELDEQSV